MSLDTKRAQALIDRERYKEAKEELLKTLTSDPEDATALSMLGWVTARLGNAKAGKVEAVKAVQIKPDSSYAHRILSLILFELGDAQAVEAEAREAIRLGPRDAFNYSALACSLNWQSRWKQGLLAAEAGLEIDPNHVNCGIYRIRALVHLKRLDEAELAAKASLSENSENPALHIAAGLACYNDGDMTDAFIHYREALRLEPSSAQARSGALRALRANYLLHRIGRAIDRPFQRVSKMRYGDAGIRFFFAAMGTISAHLIFVGSTRGTTFGILGVLFTVLLATNLDGPILYMQMLSDRSGMSLMTPEQRREGLALSSFLLAIVFCIVPATLHHSSFARGVGVGAFVAFLVYLCACHSRWLYSRSVLNAWIAWGLAGCTLILALAGFFVR